MNVGIAFGECFIAECLSYQLKIMNPEMVVAIQTGSGAKLMAYLNQEPNPPNLLFMDVRLTDTDAYVLAPVLHDQWRQMRIVILAHISGAYCVQRMLQLGCASYLTFNVAIAEIQHCFRTVFAQDFYIPNNAGEAIRQSFTRSNDPVPEISKSERAFLKLLCLGRTYSQIAEELFISKRTVDGYRDQLFSMFQLHHKVSLIRFAFQNGLF